ncbi:LysM peptidoglycan-binding domain-containing protein [Rhodocaloribacter sp.]
MHSFLRIALPALVALAFAASAAVAQPAHTYVVRRGDTLFGIAREHGASVEQLRRWNRLSGDRIHVGQRLIVSEPNPGEAPDTNDAPDAAPPDTTERRYAAYTVRPGETLYTVAQRFGLSADTLFVLNDSLTAPLEAGQMLRLPARFATKPYTVRRGDTLFRIAARHGVSVDAVRRANALRSDRIRVGQTLRIPSASATAPRPEGALPDMWAKGRVLVYPPTFAGRLTAGGAPYDPARFTVSHRTLPLGTLVLLTNPATGRSTFAEVSDRGPLNDCCIMDVSEAVARALGLAADPDAEIEIRLVP